MSGGYFDYKQHYINDVASDLEYALKDHTEDYSEEVLSELKRGLNHIKLAEIYTRRIDWLFSGDDGEANFLRRLKEDIEAKFGGSLKSKVFVISHNTRKGELGKLNGEVFSTKEKALDAVSKLIKSKVTSIHYIDEENEIYIESKEF